LIEKKLEQIAPKEIAKKNELKGNVTWMAVETRYFMSSIIPKLKREARIKLSLTPGDFILSEYIQPAILVEQGKQVSFDYSLFFGPKSMKILKEANYDLSKALNFGMFDFIGKPCLILMNMLHSVIPNYGIAIIILTILVRLLLWPLGNKSYKSMNEMKKIQPLISDIRQKYKSDPKKMNEEMMKLYKVYKINPMGGCLPMLLQLPVFFALYQMLYAAIELRHAPFLGWIKDLSAPDRLFSFGFSVPLMQPPYGIPVLTIIMGVTMLVQQKMTPQAGDPTQAKIMMWMPIIFTFIFINFPSGLVLYWLVSNIISIIQQYYTTKKLG
ncbi:MAG: membrane protein insertase YidC, partial [Desulfobacterales bacterium]|nr:membrane protein insertase YidC [Desulfobacterales bacterium]